MIKIFSLLKGAIVVIFVSFGKVQAAIFFDKINFENFLLIKVYIQNIKNWERASNIQELWVCLVYMAGAGSCDHEALDAQQYSNWTVDYVKDDGCGGCHGTAPDPALASYAAMQAGLTESHRHIFLSTEASPNLTAHSERPDLYGNTHRTGHDSQRARPKPAWDSFAVVLVVETPVSSTSQ